MLLFLVKLLLILHTGIVNWCYQYQKMPNWSYFLCNHAGKIVRKKNWKGKGFPHHCVYKGEDTEWDSVLYMTPGKVWSSTAQGKSSECNLHKVAGVEECFVEVCEVQDKIGDIINNYEFKNALLESLKCIQNNSTQTPTQQQSKTSMEVDNLVQKVTLFT